MSTENGMFPRFYASAAQTRKLIGEHHADHTLTTQNKILLIYTLNDSASLQ